MPELCIVKNSCGSHPILLYNLLNGSFYNVEMRLKALLHCNFLGNLSRTAVARQVAGELHSVTGCLAIFLLRLEALHEVELGSSFRNGLQKLTIPLHSVSPFQQLVSQFYGSFNKGASAHLFFVPRQVAEKIAQCNRPQHQTSATCNATFSTSARQVAEKIAQYLFSLVK